MNTTYRPAHQARRPVALFVALLVALLGAVGCVDDDAIVSEGGGDFSSAEHAEQGVNLTLTPIEPSEGFSERERWRSVSVRDIVRQRSLAMESERAAEVLDRSYTVLPAPPEGAYDIRRVDARNEAGGSSEVGYRGSVSFDWASSIEPERGGLYFSVEETFNEHNFDEVRQVHLITDGYYMVDGEDLYFWDNPQGEGEPELSFKFNAFKVNKGTSKSEVWMLLERTGDDPLTEGDVSFIRLQRATQR